jgi:hypothetical protein
MAVGVVALGSMSSAWSEDLKIPEQPEDFKEVPETLAKAAMDAIADVSWLQSPSLEMIVITTNQGSVLLKAPGWGQQTRYDLKKLEDPANHKVIMIPKWMPGTNPQIIAPFADGVYQFIVISTQSPGSGSDCRRGGSCQGAGG